MQKISQTTPILSENKNHYELSIYQGKLTKKGIAECLSLIKIAFPKLENSYFNTLKLMIKDEDFCDERLKDSVMHTIKTCIYPEPTIANFLNYDKNIKIYNYNQYLKLINELGNRANDLYKSVRFDGAKKPSWCHVNDIEKYRLELWNK